MGFEFKPSIWFVCRSCRQAFRYLFQLKEHKVESHLDECLRTKCLIFEERCLDIDWIPSTEELPTTNKLSSSINISNSNQGSFKNPYVFLQPLTPKQLPISPSQISSSTKSLSHETESRRSEGIKRTVDKLHPLLSPGDDEPCAKTKCTSTTLDVEYVETTASLAPQQQIVFDSEEQKIKLNIEELNWLGDDPGIASSASNSVVVSNDVQKVSEDSQEVELEDREFIVASIVQSSDGTGNIQFVSTHIPPAAEEEFTSQKQSETFHIVPDTNTFFQVLSAPDSSAADIELTSESEIHREASDIFEVEVEVAKTNGNLIQSENLFKNDKDSIIEMVSSEEFLPTVTTDLSQTEIINEEIICEGGNVECCSENANNDCVIDRKATPKNHCRIDQAFPAVTLTPEELSLPLLDWLTKEKVSDPFNVILLDPDPTSGTLTNNGKNDLQKIKCVLCKLELTSDTQVKEHVRVCWTFNKAKHLYCVPCKKSYGYTHNLKRHWNKSHKKIILTPSSGIAEGIVRTEAEAEAATLNLHQEEPQNYSQTISDFNSSAVSSEANFSPSGSRYSTRRKKVKVNYSETQACTGCAKAFYTVEDVEVHERLCPLFRHKNLFNKETTKAVDNDIQVIGSTTGNALLNEGANNEDIIYKTDCPDSIERGSDLESDDCVTDPPLRAQDSSEQSQVAPSIPLTPEDLALPFLDWLSREKVNDPSNVILLDPDPTNEAAAVVEVTCLQPIKCVLCKLKLTSVTQVKEHVKMCWHFNKLKHAYSVSSIKSYVFNKSGLTFHQHKSHQDLPATSKSCVTPPKCAPKTYKQSLEEWLLIQKQQKHSDGSLNVILINPDPSVESAEVPASIDEDHPLTCLLCTLLLVSESQVRNHVVNCWWHNKDKHRRCLPCQYTFETPKLLQTHQKYDHIEEAASATNDESDDSDAEQVGDNNDPVRGGLAEWLKFQQRQGKSSNVIRLDPDPMKAAAGPLTVSKESPIKCMLCNVKFVNESTVESHVKRCWRFRKKWHIYCVPCEQAFSSATSLTEHNCKQHFPGPEFPFHCTVCKTGFKDSKDEKFHKGSRREFLNSILHGKYAGSCSTADYSKPSETLSKWLKQEKEANPSNCILLEPDPLSLAENLEGVSEANPVKCKLCCREFTAESVLRSHLKICWFHNKMIHRHCVQCNKSYETSDRLRQHKKRKHLKGPKPIYECRVCGQKYITLATYEAHKLSHVDPEKAKPCKTFIKKQTLTGHVAVHTVGKTDPEDTSNPTGTLLNCKFCDRFFTSKQQLRNHERTHTGPGGRPFKCQVADCNQTFSNTTTRRIHLKWKHCEELDLTQSLCPSCGKIFGLQSELDYHIQRFHTEAKDKPFKKHQLTHNDDDVAGNKIPCDLCPKKFRDNWALKRHLKHHQNQPKKEAGSKPKFKCQLCGKIYATKSGLRKHEESHEDEDEKDEEEEEDEGDVDNETDESESSESDIGSENPESAKI